MFKIWVQSCPSIGLVDYSEYLFNSSLLFSMWNKNALLLFFFLLLQLFTYIFIVERYI